jgi:nucleosome assembly protein 1-like 1
MPRRRGNRRIEEEEDDDDEEEEEEVEQNEDGDEVEDGDDEDEDDEDPLLHLPDYVLARVDKLKELHTARESILDQYIVERATLEKKYEALFQPIYTDRAAIIQGSKDEEIKTALLMITPAMVKLTTTDNNTTENDVIVPSEVEEEKADIEEEGFEPMKGIPQFWACAMTRIEVIGELLTVDDLGCLDHLTNISCSEHDDGKGFTLTFHFSNENEYFSNPTLTKTYIVPNLLTSDEPMLKDVKGTTIYWKTGMSLTHKIVKKKQRGKGKNAGQVRSVTKQEEKESFFHWFTPPEMPTSVDDMDEEEAEQLEELFESDFEIAQAFRNHIVPNAVMWFTGQVRFIFPLFCFPK